MGERAVEERIEFIDLHAQQHRIGEVLHERIDRVLAHGRYILGPEVPELEEALSELVGVDHVVACANGTDALVLAMRALGLQRGQGVLVPAFTFCATAEAVVLCGGVPVFVDVQEDSFNLDPGAVAAAVAWCRSEGIEVAGVIAVDLFGQPADYPELEDAAGDDLWVLADAAQSFGGVVGDQRVGSLARISTTSFFPAKPLGCYGDGGAVLTDDRELAAAVVSLRGHGQGADKYDNVRIGYNSRLDTLQAAILLAKLTVFEDEILRRQQVAAHYAAGLEDAVEVPRVAAGKTSAWAQYTVLLRPGLRERVRAALREAGIPTAIYYPRPLHLQTAYAAYPVAGPGLPESESLAERVLSLPMHPYLDVETQDRIVAQLRLACGDGS